MKNIRIFGFTAVSLILGLSVQSNTLFAKGVSQKVKENLDTLLKTNSCVNCDLEGADFIRKDMVEVNLENANLENAKFQLADLSKCNLRNANLQGANFGGADLSNCDLQGAIFSDNTLSGAYLAGVTFSKTQKEGTLPQKENGVDVSLNTQGSGEKKQPVEMKKSKKVPVVDKVQIAERRDFEETPPILVSPQIDSKKEESSSVSKSDSPEDLPKVSTKSVKPFQDVVIEKPPEKVIAKVKIIEGNDKSLEKVEVAEDIGFFEKIVEQPKEDMIVEENIEPQKEELQKDTNEIEKNNKDVMVSSAKSPIVSEETIEKVVATKEEVAVDVDAEKIILLEKLKDNKECFKCDLSGLDLSGKKFSKVDLEGADLSNCNLEKTNFSNSNLKGANFSGANLKGANFKKADLYKAVFTGADLTDAKLTAALIDDAQLTDAVGVQINSVMLDGNN